ncbi:hypothetical protein [Rhodoferax sp.]|uniref:hypothetical protein n=1 Tax=Rhodoferax sp. TaxID=50421 RepID=UPI0039B8FFA9
MASSCYVWMPAHFKKPRAMVWLLLFNFAFITPVVGAIGMLFMTRIALRQAAKKSLMAVPISVELPEYDVQGKDINRSGQGAIRSRLGGNVPAEIRMQSLLTLQAVPNRVSNPILETLLGDSTDDVRLVAFGMLDAEEKKISVHIQREREALLRELTPEQRYACLRHLAELHWELIYASLAQGELRNHILGQARQYLEEAFAVGVPPNSGLVFLKGRILLAQGEIEDAQAAIELAVALGQPKISALPYLAEMAFKRRELALVKPFMQQLVALNAASRTRAIADFWIGSDNVSNFSDRRFLPHI